VNETLLGHNKTRQIPSVRVNHYAWDNLRLQHPPMGGSDHWPVQLEAGFQTTPKNNTFRFEKFWMEHLTFKEKIKQWWYEEKPKQGTRMFKLYKKLKHIKHRLKECNKDTFENINQEKKTIEEIMKKLQETCI
jgi:hypothetical protein